MNISDNEPEIVKPGIFARLRGWFFTGLLGHGTGFIDRLYHMGRD